jgi:hypothetical protein
MSRVEILYASGARDHVDIAARGHFVHQIRRGLQVNSVILRDSAGDMIESAPVPPPLPGSQ